MRITGIEEIMIADNRACLGKLESSVWLFGGGRGEAGQADHTPFLLWPPFQVIAGHPRLHSEKAAKRMEMTCE